MGDGEMGKESGEQVPVSDSVVGNKPKGTRRSFLKNPFNIKIGLKTAAAVGAAWYLGGKDVFTEGIPTSVTPSGTFSILYERHDIGIREKDLPKKKIDFLFKEGVSLSDENPPDVGFPLLTTDFGHNKTLFAYPEELMEEFSNLELPFFCARKGIPIIFSDIVVPQDLLVYLARSGAGAIVGLSALRGLLDDSEETKKIAAEDPEMDKMRRNILKGLGLVGLAASADLASVLLSTVTDFGGAPSAIKRITQRIEGLTSHFSPDMAVRLFRNAVWAHKLLAAGHNIKEEQQQVPEIMCDVGSGHAGFEDFLMAGQEVCEAVILAYGRDFLLKVLERNGGPNGLSSSRIVRFPQNEGLTSLRDINWDEVKTEVILDKTLEETILRGLNLTKEEVEKFSGPRRLLKSS